VLPWRREGEGEREMEGRGRGEECNGYYCGVDLTSWLQGDHLSLSVRFDLCEGGG